MRYAPTERFWRNLLLTCVFTVFTLGFSVASWHGLKVTSPERPALDGNRGIAKQMAAAESNVGYQESARAARQPGAPLEDLDLGDVSPPVAAFAAGDSRATGAEAAGAFGTAAEATGNRGEGQQSSAASSSGRVGAAVGGGGGFPGPSFGGGSAKNTQLSANTGKGPSAARNSNTKRNDKKGGGSNKGKTTKKTPTSGPSEARGETPSSPEGLYGGSPASGSPASTPEPLSMVLVGTGLVGLYRARKYLI
jgi:hypothetical protein